MVQVRRSSTLACELADSWEVFEVGAQVEAEAEAGVLLFQLAMVPAGTDACMEDWL